MKNIHLPVQIQPRWLSGIQHNFLVSDLTAIQRLNIIIAHALWIPKTSLAPHFALLLIEWKKQYLASLKYLFIINAFNRLQGHNLSLFVSESSMDYFAFNLCLRHYESFTTPIFYGFIIRPLFQNIWNITKVLRHQYFRGLLTFLISK